MGLENYREMTRNVSLFKEEIGKYLNNLNCYHDTGRFQVNWIA